MGILSISSTVNYRKPNLPFAEIKDDILGKKYELSLTFIGKTRAKTLNIQYRNKDYVPNVLSFPLTNSVGDIFICPEVARKEASKFDLSPKGYIAFLFIHGCLHLKGLDHGATMEKLEEKYRKKYRLK